MWCETHETSPPNVKERAIGAGGGSNSRVGRLQLRNLQLIDFRIFREAGSPGEVRVDGGTGYLGNQRNSFVLKYILLVSESGQRRPPVRCLYVYTRLRAQHYNSRLGSLWSRSTFSVGNFFLHSFLHSYPFSKREPTFTPYLPHWYTTYEEGEFLPSIKFWHF